MATSPRSNACRYTNRDSAARTSSRRTLRLSAMFATATLVLSLFMGMLAPSGLLAHPAYSRARAAHATAAMATTAHTRRRRRHVSGAAARAVERRLLLVASRSKLLARFVDRSTGLVQRNVTARCELRRARQRRPSVYVCRVWRQPRLPSSGTRVLCRTRHKRFVVMAYRRRHRY